MGYAVVRGFRSPARDRPLRLAADTCPDTPVSSAAIHTHGVAGSHGGCGYREAPYHAFLSHAHVNKAQAEQLYDFLSRVAGIPVWYDAVNLPPGASFVLGLYEAIVESRSAIILLSRESVDSGWVEQERDAALNQLAMNRKFHVIPLRLDDVTPPDFVTNFSNIEIGQAELDSASAAQILQALYQPAHLVPGPGHGKHTYFSRGWQASDAAQAGAVSEALSSTGLRLVGDARTGTSMTWDVSAA